MNQQGDNREMEYPLPHGRVLQIDLTELGSAPFAELQRIASTLRGAQLMRVSWSDQVQHLGTVCDELARFHDWLGTNTPHDSCYIVHSGLTAVQQGQLHQSLREKQVTAAIVRDDHLLLIGDVPPIFDDLVSVIIATHNLTADEIAARLSSYAKGYVQTQLGAMARRRIVARKRKLGPIPQLPGIRRNRWHYYPLWSPCATGKIG